MFLLPFAVLRVLIYVLVSNGSQGFVWIGFAVGVPLVMLWWFIRMRMGWTGMYWNPLSQWAGGRVADALTQWPTKPGQAPAPVGPVQAPATYYDTHPPPLDWHGIVGSISVRLEEALGDGFSIEPAGYSPVLHYGDSRQIVPLTGALETPPLDEGPRAVRACRKMMHETQQFAQLALGHSWPDEGAVRTSLDGSSTSGGTGLGQVGRVEIEANVELRDGQIRLAYVGADGALLLQLPPIPFPG